MLAPTVIRLLLGCSVAVNLLLLISANSVRSSKPTGAGEVAVEQLPHSTLPQNPVSESVVIPQLHAGHPSRRTSPDWSSVQSDDLTAFVRNMRIAGFPESVVQVVISTELEAVFAKRRATIPLQTNYWQTGPARDHATVARKQFEKALTTERRAMMMELVGVEWTEAPTMQKLQELFAIVSYAGVSPSDEGLERVHQIWSRITDEARELRNPIDLITPEITDRKELIFQSAVDGLRQELGEAGIEELMLVGMAVEVSDVWGSEILFGCVMTGQELHELLRIKAPEKHHLAGLFGLDLDEPPPRSDEAIGSTESRLRLLLGEERFQGYLRAKDPEFRRIYRSIPKGENHMALSWATYDIFSTARELARQARLRVDSTEAQRQSELIGVRLAAERALQAAVGPEIFATVKASPWQNWLEDLTKAP